MGTFSADSSALFTSVSHCFCLSASLLSSIKRCSRLILCVYFLPQSWNQQFFQGTWVAFMENGIRHQHLDTIFAHYYWGVISRPTQLTEEGNTCVYKFIYHLTWRFLSLESTSHICLSKYKMLYIHFSFGKLIVKDRKQFRDPHRTVWSNIRSTTSIKSKEKSLPRYGETSKAK